MNCKKQNIRIFFTLILAAICSCQTLISLSTAIGYDLPMSDKVIEKNHHTTLMNLSRRPTPFARVKVSCRM